MTTADSSPGGGHDPALDEELSAGEVRNLLLALEARLERYRQRQASGHGTRADKLAMHRLEEQLAVLRQEALIAEFLEGGRRLVSRWDEQSALAGPEGAPSP